MLASIIEEKSFCAPLAFIIASARADWIDVTPILLALRMNLGITIDLGGRRLKYLRLHALRESQHVDRPKNARLGRLYGVELIVNGGRRASQIEDFIDLDVQREANIVSYTLEPGV